MYYRYHYSSNAPLYHSLATANRLLLRIYLQLEGQRGILLDYTLLPTQLDLLLYTPKVKPYFRFLPKTYTQEHISEKEALITHYKSISNTLPEAGRDYPLCGTYEAYHSSNCLCSLGKMGPFPQELSIQTILKEKSTAHCL